MKKIVSVTLASIMIFMGTVSFAEMDSKLENHWAKSSIKKDFVAYYFPYLAKESFLKFNPSEEIQYNDFLISINSLYKDYGIEINMDRFGVNEKLTRESMLSILNNEIFKSYMDIYKSENIKFTDVEGFSEEQTDLLKVLVKLNIIAGVSDTSFAPEKGFTQAEAIIVLQRIKSVFDKMNLVGYRIIGVTQSYTGEEGFVVEELEDRLVVSINKSFPTPGYSMTVDKITTINDGYKINLKITEPNSEMILPQVITNINLKLEIDKKLLTKDIPYNFAVEGLNNNLNK